MLVNLSDHISNRHNQIKMNETLRIDDAWNSNLQDDGNDSLRWTLLMEDFYSRYNESVHNLSANGMYKRDPLYIVVPITIVYALIFFTGVIGNVSTCVVIARNKSMHTATNYYLFSLAVSDLLLLVSGIPPEMYKIWYPSTYVFGEAFCLLHGFASEISANATVLTITAFTVERYIAICHPFLSHTMSKLSRAVKFVIAIWVLALCLAFPQAIQFGVVHNSSMMTTLCTIKWVVALHAFEVSGFVFFVGPMTVITVLYILIGVKLRRSRLLQVVKRSSVSSYHNSDSTQRPQRNGSQTKVIRMLVAVTVAFFLCWAPFHAQRMLAVYAQTVDKPGRALITIYNALTYISGVMYFLSTCVNPLLYNIMSNKFREAFKSTLAQQCGIKQKKKKKSRPSTYSALSRCGASLRNSMNRTTISEDVNLHRTTGVCTDSLVLHNNFQPKPIRGDRNGHAFRTRGMSDSSQATGVTSLSRSNGEGNNNFHSKHGQIARRETQILDRSISDTISENVLRKSAPGGVGIGAIAERLRRGTRAMFMKGEDCKNIPNDSRRTKSLESGCSIDSAHTNTISNSSLQDMDEEEFTGSELARYMEEINRDIV